MRILLLLLVVTPFSFPGNRPYTKKALHPGPRAADAIFGCSMGCASWGLPSTSQELLL